jgi:GNAT superfamily N-acetyltransferase
MSVENLEGDFGATCWVGGCWVDPRFRGKGVMRALFSYIDEFADRSGWSVQGLGVWTDNEVAISAYLALGFLRAGVDIASTKHPGKSYVRMIRSTK